MSSLRIVNEALRIYETKSMKPHYRRTFMKTNIWLLAGALALAPAAWAGNCPNLMAEVDEILASNSNLDEETIVDEDMRKSVKEMRMEGEELHKAGKHAESVKTLKEAEKMLGIE